MKEVFVFSIGVYQVIFSPLLKILLGTSRLCKYTPSCSEYTKQKILHFGIMKGSLLGLERVVSCR